MSGVEGEVVAPQPGWYADPDDGGGVLRWWDGAGWTEHRFGIAEPAEPAEFIRTHPAHLATPSRPRRAPLPEGTAVYTPWIWILILLPLLSTATLLLTDPAHALLRRDPILVATAFVALIVWIGGAVLARLDQTDLVTRGVQRPFPWLWALFGAVVYAIGRSVIVRRVSGRGIAPIPISIVVTALAAIAATAWLLTALEATVVETVDVPTILA